MLRALLCAVALVSCQDRLAYLQQTCGGTWELQSRELSDGTVLHRPDVVGLMYWHAIDTRKAHVTVTIIAKGEHFRLDHSASTYEISTSAITRKRHFLAKKGYRPTEVGVQSYSVELTRKGKLSIEDDDSIVMTHLAIPDEASHRGDQIGYRQVFQGNTMVASYQDTFRDTWKKLTPSGQ